jgi:hypothetical protein
MRAVDFLFSVRTKNWLKSLTKNGLPGFPRPSSFSLEIA